MVAVVVGRVTCACFALTYGEPAAVHLRGDAIGAAAGAQARGEVAPGDGEAVGGAGAPPLRRGWWQCPPPPAGGGAALEVAAQ